MKQNSKYEIPVEKSYLWFPDQKGEDGKTDEESVVAWFIKGIYRSAGTEPLWLDLTRTCFCEGEEETRPYEIVSHDLTYDVEEPEPGVKLVNFKGTVTRAPYWPSEL